MEVFDDTFIPSGLSEVRPAGRHCPRCVWPYLHPVRSLDELGVGRVVDRAERLEHLGDHMRRV